MKKNASILILILSVFFTFSVKAQELNCSVTVNSTQIIGSDKSIFDVLEKAVFEFVNNRKWTANVYDPDERIEASILINITEQIATGNFKATIQVQSRRPVYGTSYNSTLLNLLDKEFDFQFNEFDPLTYSETSFINNLTSVISYYVYIILAFDYDSFSLGGGTPYLDKALTIVNNSQSASEPGWKAFEGDKNRYWLVQDLLRDNYAPYREALYKYHRLGFDVMTQDTPKGRAEVLNSLKLLENIYTLKPGAFILQIFFNAKINEIISLFKEATTQEKAEVITLINKIDPAN
ncbi:MAG: DUF4835 family protein, partial [Vicingus serpentipes]|nr:DUF4835 family protein [Vicingus serpentipes]